MFLNAVNRIREELLLGYQSINRHYEFAEYFVTECDIPSYSWNVHIHNSLGHSLLVVITNDTCIKYPMAPQA